MCFITEILFTIWILLQQISSPHESRNYSDQKIEEFKQQIDELKREHQKFVAKVQKLDPSYKDIIPWQPRGYSRKRSHDSLEPASDTSTTGSASKKLCSPLLEKEQQERSHGSHVTIINPETSKYNYNPLGLEYSSSEDESWQQVTKMH